MATEEELERQQGDATDSGQGNAVERLAETLGSFYVNVGSVRRPTDRPTPTKSGRTTKHTYQRYQQLTNLFFLLD